MSDSESATSTPDRTAAERMRRARRRRRSSGLVEVRRWVHPEDVPAVDDLVHRLAQYRGRSAVGDLLCERCGVHVTPLQADGDSLCPGCGLVL